MATVVLICIIKGQEVLLIPRMAVNPSPGSVTLRSLGKRGKSTPGKVTRIIPPDLILVTEV